jgi:hypothetical protein
VFESNGSISAPDASSPLRVRATDGTVHITGPRSLSVDSPLAPETLAGNGCIITADASAPGTLSMLCSTVNLYRRLSMYDGDLVVDIQVRGVLTAYGQLSAARTANL